METCLGLPQPTCEMVSQVVCMLATLIFGIPNLSWDPIDHFETFAGKMSITKGEAEVVLALRVACLGLYVVSDFILYCVLLCLKVQCWFES